MGYNSGKGSYEMPTSRVGNSATSKKTASSTRNEAKDIIIRYMELIKEIEDLNDEKAKLDEKIKGKIQERKLLDDQIRNNPDCMGLLNLLGRNVLQDNGQDLGDR